MSSVTLIPNFSAVLFNNDMDTIEEIRLKRLLLLRGEYGSSAEFAKKIDISEAQLSQWINKSPDSKTGKPRSISSESARKIETATGKQRGWMDQAVDNFSGYDPEMREMLKLLSMIDKDERKFFKKSLGVDEYIHEQKKIANGNGNSNSNSNSRK